MSPRWGSTPRLTDRLTVIRNVTLTWPSNDQIAVIAEATRNRAKSAILSLDWQRPCMYYILWHVNQLLGCATGITQQSVARYPTAKRLATEYTLRSSRGSGVCSVPFRAAGGEEQAAMTSHGSTLASKATPRKRSDRTQQSWLAPFFVSLVLAI
jgi:hypothetical protein